jgi:hypothetical protein
MKEQRGVLLRGARCSKDRVQTLTKKRENTGYGLGSYGRLLPDDRRDHDTYELLDACVWSFVGIADHKRTSKCSNRS